MRHRIRWTLIAWRSIRAGYHDDLRAALIVLFSALAGAGLWALDVTLAGWLRR